MEAFGRRLPLRAAGMLLRELTRHHPPSATTLESLVTHWSHDFTTRFTPAGSPSKPRQNTRPERPWQQPSTHLTPDNHPGSSHPHPTPHTPDNPPAAHSGPSTDH